MNWVRKLFSNQDTQPVALDHPKGSIVIVKCSDGGRGVVITRLYSGDKPHLLTTVDGNSWSIHNDGTLNRLCPTTRDVTSIERVVLPE